jgi:hypothetical protein
MTPKIKKIVVAVVTFLIFTNLVTLALLWKDHQEKFPGRSKPYSNLKIVVERVPNSTATPDFNFTEVPAPARTNAATFARYSLMTGLAGGMGLRNLRTSHLPSGPDAPDENFFFQDGTYGGRLLVDFNQAIAIQQVNTYSWHTGARAPQVYRLYALDDVSNAEPVGYKDPATLGWKFLAEVDTRPKSGDVGGQYGVSISSPNEAIGHYRYLLFEIKRTEEADRWGNTFYSRIDVLTN